jgi:D-3-phosphoglycerate dehydrogenase
MEALVNVLFVGNRAVLHPWYDDFVAAIGGRHPIKLYDPDQPMHPQFRWADVVVEVGGAFNTHAMIDAAVEAGVKLWQIMGTGLDHVDVRYFLENGMPLANTPGQFSSVALAEHALFLMLCFAKNFRASQQSLRSRVFYRPVNEELEGKTLGIVGLGASGRELARRASAMGMRILAVDVAAIPQQVLDELRVEFFGGPQNLDRLLMASDYVSLHVPLTSKTRRLIDRRALGLMKPEAVLINVARGGIVDEAALIEALEAGRLRGAGLDAFVEEPLSPTHPFLHMENVVVTPHVAGVTTGTSRRRAAAAAENVDRVARGLPPLYLVTSVE